MLHRSILVSMLACFSLALPGAAAAAPGSSGAVVFSKVSFEGRAAEGAEAGEVAAEPEGGLFAARDRHLNQLTENPADSQPAFSPDGRRIAFVRGGDVWAMRADGSGQHGVTSGAEVDGRPIFAPNGRYLLFDRRATEGAPRDLYTVRPSGSGLRQLTSSVHDDGESAFAPGGGAIAFVRGIAQEGGGVATDVLSISPAGTRQRRLTRTAAIDEFAPRYFGRGSIVFSRGQADQGPGSYADVFTMRGNGRRVRGLIRGAGSAYVEDVSPNGRLLLFRRDQGLWVKPLVRRRKGSVRVRKLVQLGDVSRTNAVFSADGRRVAAFVAAGESQSLSAIDVATRKVANLARGFSYEESASGEIGPIMAWQPLRGARR